MRYFDNDEQHEYLWPGQIRSGPHPFVPHPLTNGFQDSCLGTFILTSTAAVLLSCVTEKRFVSFVQDGMLFTWSAS